MRNIKQRAFTLIELLVVIAIIGILSGIILTSVNKARGKGRVAAVKQTMKTIQTHSQAYYSDNGSYTGFCSDPKVVEMVSMIPTPRKACYAITPSSIGQRWAVAAYLEDGTILSISQEGLLELEKTDRGGGGVEWAIGRSLCTNAGKRLPTVEELKAVHAAFSGSINTPTSDKTPPTFQGGNYWTGTPHPSANNTYQVGMAWGGVTYYHNGSYEYVRCGS